MSGGGIYRSTDGGGNWTQVKPLIGVADLVAADTTFFAATGSGLLVTTDNGANLTPEDKVDIATMQDKVRAHQELLEARNSDNTEANVKYKFEKVLDEIMLDFVNTKLDLYKKLSDVQVNAYLKQKWFEDFYRDKGTETRL